MHEKRQGERHDDEDGERRSVDAMGVAPCAVGRFAVAHELLRAENRERRNEAARPGEHAGRRGEIDDDEEGVTPRR